MVGVFSLVFAINTTQPQISSSNKNNNHNDEETKKPLRSRFEKFLEAVAASLLDDNGDTSTVESGDRCGGGGVYSLFRPDIEESSDDDDYADDSNNNNNKRRTSGSFRPLDFTLALDELSTEGTTTRTRTTNPMLTSWEVRRRCHCRCPTPKHSPWGNPFSNARGSNRNNARVSSFQGSGWKE